MNKYYRINNLFFLIIFFLSSCITIDQQFGDDLIPNEQDLIVSRNVLSLSKFGYLSSPRPDSFPTSDFSVGFLGQMTTDEFGFSKASIMTQLSLISPGFKLPSGAVIDSVVMYVAFTSDKFGGTGDLTLKVYEVIDDLTDSVYYGANRNFLNHIPNYDKLLCAGIFNKYTKTVKMKVDTVGLLSKLQTFSADSSFKKVFKGIFMTVEGSDDGAIKGVDLLTYRTQEGTYYASTYLRLHYKYFHPTAQRDTVDAYTYICQSRETQDKRFLIVEHDPTYGEINQNLTPAISYTQGLYGNIGSLKFNRDAIEQNIGIDLESIAINRAELRLKLQHPLDIERLDSFYTPLIGTYTKEWNKDKLAYYSYTLDFNKYISALSQGLSSTYDGALNRTTGTYNIEITHAMNNLIRTGSWQDSLLLLPQSYGQSCKSAAFITDSTQLVLTYVRKKQ